MKHGDFTELAKFYGNRPGYSKVVLECLKNHVFNTVGEGKVADIGAGTGKLTENLAEIGLILLRPPTKPGRHRVVSPLPFVFG